MDRTEELSRIVLLFQPLTQAQQSQTQTEPTSFQRYASRVSANLEGNEVLVRRIDKLATMKEFSNDPSQAMRFL